MRWSKDYLSSNKYIYCWLVWVWRHKLLGFALKDLFIHFLEITITVIKFSFILFGFIMNDSASACDFIISLNKGAFRMQKWKQISCKLELYKYFIIPLK